MYAQLAYNISIVFLLSFGLNKMALLFGAVQNGNKKFRSSLFVDLGIIVGLDIFFSDQALNMKASIYSIFLVMLYLKTISKYLGGSLQKVVFIIS